MVYKKGTNTNMKALVKKVNKLDKFVKQTETKRIELTHYNDISVVPNTTAPIYMLLISQGDDSSSRDGNLISLKKMELKFRLRWSTVGTPTQLSLKYWVIRDSQNVADGTPTVAEIFDGNNTLAKLNTISGMSRFKILASGKKIYDNQIQMLEWDKTIQIPKYAQSVRFNGVSSGDIQKGGIYIVCQAYHGTGAANSVGTLTCYNRISYTDV